MLRTERMYKVTIACAKKYMEEVIETLYNLGCLHIKEYEKTDSFFDIGKPFERAGRISKLLLKLRNLLNTLSAVEKCDHKKKGEFKNFDELEEWCDSIAERVDELNLRIKELEDEMSKIRSQLQQLRLIEKLGLNPRDLWDYETIEWRIVHTRNKELLSNLQRNGGMFVELRVTEHEKGWLIAIFYKKENEGDVEKLLARYDHKIVDVSDISNLDVSAAELRKKLLREKEELCSQIEKLKRELKNLATKSIPVLRYWIDVLEEEAEKAEAPLKFASSENAFIISGWVPKKNSEILRKSLEKITNGKVFIRFDEIDERKEDAPVKFAHPKGVDNFQALMEMYSFPKYGEIDPTLFVAITFPIYFGFILGDVGYGLACLFAFLLIKKKMPQLKKIANVFIFSAVVTIFFGFIYGEFFGMNEIMGFRLPTLIHRIHDTMTLLYLAVAIGIVHVNLGFILGAINEYRLYGIKKALLEKISWILIEVGAVLWYASSKSYLSLPWELGASLTIVAFLMLAVSEGIKGVVELPTLFSHTLSYARLMGAGVASAGLAMVINSTATGFVAKGPVYIIFAIMLVVFGHIFNIMLGVLEGFLHSIRLNYVEFFTKFFIGGGFPYNPFGRKKGTR